MFTLLGREGNKWTSYCTCPGASGLDSRIINLPRLREIGIFLCLGLFGLSSLSGLSILSGLLLSQ